MTGPELHLVEGEPDGPVEESPERCLCGRLVRFIVQLRKRSIGLCDRCYDARIETLKRGSGRGA